MVIFGYSFDEYYFSQNKSTSQYYLFYNSSITNATYAYLREDEREINFTPPIDVDFQSNFTISNKIDDEYEFGYFDKSQIYLNINGGFIYALEYLGGDKDDKSRYDIIKADGHLYRTNGIYLKKIYNNHFFKLNYLNGKDFNQVSFDGFLQEGDGERYIIDAKHHYSYKNYITNGKVKSYSISGSGYSVDFGYFDSYKDINYIFQVENLGYILWRDIPYYTATADNQVIYLGDDGYNHYRPIVQAKYSTTKTEYFKLIPSYIFAINYDEKLVFVWKNIEDINYYFISNQITRDIKLGYFINSKDISISYDITKKFSFNSTISLLKPNENQGINISLAYKF